MPVFVIDQWVDARCLSRRAALRKTVDAVLGLARGQVAEVMVSDLESATDVLTWLETKPLDLLEASALRDAFQLILRHR